MSKAIQDKIALLLLNSAVFNKVEVTLGVPDFENLAIVGNEQAWVIELYSRPDDPLPGLGNILQQEHQVYAVLIGIKTVNDKGGIRAVATLEQKRQDTRQAIFQVAPAGGYDRFSLVSSELMHYSKNAVFWVERFKTSHLISAENLL